MAVAALETRFSAMSASKEPGIWFFSAARKASLPSTLPLSKLPRRLSRGLGDVEYALWKSVSESSVVPVSAGVRAGVVGTAASEIGASSSPFVGGAVGVVIAVVFVVVVVVVVGGLLLLTSPFSMGISARVGVMTSSTLELEFPLRLVSIESRRVLAVLLDVTVSPRFLEPLGILLATPEALRERGRDIIAVPSLSLSGLLDRAFHCLSRSAASAFSNYFPTQTSAPSSRIWMNQRGRYLLLDLQHLLCNPVAALRDTLVHSRHAIVLSFTT